MPNHENELKTNKAAQFAKQALAGVGVTLIMTGAAFAEEAGGNQVIDLTTAVTGVAIVAGLLAAGSLKAVPTYAGWGIKKALAMLR